MQIDPVHIRTTTEADLDFIPSLIGQLGYQINLNEIKKRYKAISPTSILLIAINSIQIIGLIHLEIRYSLISERYLEVVLLAVDEQWRCKGVGQQLLTAAEKWASDQNCDLVQLYSNAKRKQAHRFYYNQGYRKVKDSVMIQKYLTRFETFSEVKNINN